MLQPRLDRLLYGRCWEGVEAERRSRLGFFHHRTTPHMGEKFASFSSSRRALSVEATGLLGLSLKPQQPLIS